MLYKLTWGIPKPRNDQDSIICHKIFFYGMWNTTTTGLLEEYYFEGGSLIYDSRFTFDVFSQFHTTGVCTLEGYSDSYMILAQNIVLNIVSRDSAIGCSLPIHSEKITRDEALKRYNFNAG